MKLSEAIIRKLPVGQVFDSMFPGLALQKRETNRHSWSYWYRIDGKLKHWTIGRWPRISLAKARNSCP